MYVGSLIGDDHPDFEQNILRLRKPGEFSGLINRGTTCYANSSLQSWFHNPIIRNAILSSNIDPEDSKKGIMLELQRLFGFLKFSIFREVDPSNLYNALNINNQDQHDAQEFALKLIDFLSEEDANLKEIFENNIHGSSKYETKCKKCQCSVEHVEKYTCIDLLPQHSLPQALGEKLIVEELESYRCEKCNDVTGADRTLEFLSFPPVLMFQINRYRYNSRTKTSNKITTSFNYPDEYDFQAFLTTSSDENHVYSAFAAVCMKYLHNP